VDRCIGTPLNFLCLNKGLFFMTSVRSLSENLTLESVKAQLSQWRATHGKGHRIPLTLWNAVQELTKSYSPQRISSELKIRPSCLRKKCGISPRNLSLPTSSPFVQVSLPPLSTASPRPIPLEQKYLTYTGSIELTRKDGTSLKVSGLENKSLLSIVQEFLKQ
jgi:hypothetical protein